MCVCVCFVCVCVCVCLHVLSVCGYPFILNLKLQLVSDASRKLHLIKLEHLYSLTSLLELVMRFSPFSFKTFSSSSNVDKPTSCMHDWLTSSTSTPWEKWEAINIRVWDCLINTNVLREHKDKDKYKSTDGQTWLPVLKCTWVFWQRLPASLLPPS